MAGTILDMLDYRLILLAILAANIMQIPNKAKTLRRWRGNLWRNLFVKPYNKIRGWLR